MTNQTENKPNQLLVNILSTRRADQSAGDTNFRLWLHATLQSMKANIQILSRGNIYVTVGNSKTLFSCHIDTRHTVAESTGQMQQIEYDPHLEHIFLAKGTNSNCLGADDGAGIYIMLKMIQHNIPGGYMFHTGEERGGLGAKEVLKNHSDILKQYERAIAFDRPNTDEVIVSQGGMACASVIAGNTLAELLNKHNLTYVVSHKGVFTDTKVYAHIIPECFNLGVGYSFQHTPDETLDYGHLSNLLEACLLIDWESIPTTRKPIQAPPTMPKQPVFTGSNNGYITKPKTPIVFPDNDDDDNYVIESDYEELFEMTLEELETYAETSPYSAASQMAKLVTKVMSQKAEIKQLQKILGFI